MRLHYSGGDPILLFSAILAQLVEQLIRNEQVVGSSPMDGSKKKTASPKWEAVLLSPFDFLTS
jgi:hypothetical protein